ncbi:D-glycero-beta-D-manno-heptose-7-phosphate kinase [Candidatus Woesearchaeota archaeon]|nr:D-glycero-beta-D-manno-heptose-7-phosphate kinase [Candidatus Woesearchaeota archaeon]
MTNKERLLSLIQRFEQQRIVVLGDVMLDKYLWGSVTRISPEAPVPVLKVERESYVPGAAGNTAHNVAALGGKAMLITISGAGEDQQRLKQLLQKGNVAATILTDSSRQTIVKVRAIAQRQQLLRIDYDGDEEIDTLFEQQIIDLLKEHLPEVDGIIISDYAKGFVTKNLVEQVVKLAHGKPIIVDPKPLHADYYRGVSVMTPNWKEALEMSGLGKGTVEEVGKIILGKIGVPVLITRGELGMSLFEKRGKEIHIPTKAREVYDVSGAGDTAIAALSLAITAGASLTEAAMIANYAAGVTVGKVGTSTVSPEELQKAIEQDEG